MAVVVKVLLISPPVKFLLSSSRLPSLTSLSLSFFSSCLLDRSLHVDTYGRTHRYSVRHTNLGSWGRYEYVRMGKEGLLRSSRQDNNNIRFQFTMKFHSLIHTSLSLPLVQCWLLPSHSCRCPPPRTLAGSWKDFLFLLSLDPVCLSVLSFQLAFIAMKCSIQQPSCSYTYESEFLLIYSSFLFFSSLLSGQLQ